MSALEQTPTYVMGVPWDQDRVRNIVAMRELTNATVVWDQKHDAMDTWLRMLQMIGSRAAICMEDDVELATDWRSLVEQDIAERPDDVIQFFSMRKADLSEGSRYEPGRTFTGNLCHYLPEGAAAEMCRYAPQWIAEHPEHPTGCDLLLRDWMRSTGRRYWIRVPNLVQHLPLTSAIDPRRSKARRSLTFPERTTS